MMASAVDVKRRDNVEYLLEKLLVVNPDSVGRIRRALQHASEISIIHNTTKSWPLISQVQVLHYTGVQCNAVNTGESPVFQEHTSLIYDTRQF